MYVGIGHTCMASQRIECHAGIQPQRQCTARPHASSPYTIFVHTIYCCPKLTLPEGEITPPPPSPGARHP